MIGVISNKKNATGYIKKVPAYFFILIVTLGSVFPFVWMMSASLKTEATVFEYPIRWIPKEPAWENYVEIFQKVSLLVYFKNTFIVSISVTLIQIFLSSLAAYAFSKIVFPGRDILFILFLATLMIPYQAIMIPIFVIVKNIGLIDKLLGLILSCSFNTFSIFFMKQYFMTIPNELVEAARIDGLSEVRIYSMIMMPLARPALATLFIYTFVGAWNDFLGL